MSNLSDSTHDDLNTASTSGQSAASRSQEDIREYRTGQYSALSNADGSPHGDLNAAVSASDQSNIVTSSYGTLSNANTNGADPEATQIHGDGEGRDRVAEDGRKAAHTYVCEGHATAEAADALRDESAEAKSDAVWPWMRGIFFFFSFLSPLILLLFSFFHGETRDTIAEDGRKAAHTYGCEGHACHAKLCT